MLVMDSSLQSVSMYIGIKALYGIDLMARGDHATEMSTTLINFIEICVVAVQYDIEGLLDSALKAASVTLTDCLSDENEAEGNSALRVFLGFSSCSSWYSNLDDKRYTPFLFKVLKEHLHKIHNKPVFQELLDQEPKLARYLLDAMMEDQAQRVKDEK
jgi:hypothetical protein